MQLSSVVLLDSRSLVHSSQPPPLLLPPSPLGAATYPRASGVRPCGSCAPSCRPWRRVPTPHPATVAYVPIPALGAPVVTRSSREVSAPSYSARSSCNLRGIPLLRGCSFSLAGLLRPGAARGPGGHPCQQLCELTQLQAFTLCCHLAWLYPAVQPLHEARIALPSVAAAAAAPAT